MFSCKKDKKDSPKELTPEDAKIELNDASQQFDNQIVEIMQTESVQTANFLLELLGIDLEFDLYKNLLEQPGNIHLTKIKNALKAANSTNSSNELEEYGIYEFDFDSEEFIMVEPTDASIIFYFPADETAYMNMQNNAEIAMTNIQTTIVLYTEEYWDWELEQWVTETYEEEVPTNCKITEKVDGATLATINYNSTITENGFPTAFNVSADVPPYNINTTLNGSGTKFQTQLSFKKNSTSLFSFDLTIEYTSDMENIKKINGNLTPNPLKIEGFINIFAIETHMYEHEFSGDWDIDYLNGQIDLELIQVEKNAKIGDIEYKSYYDYPALAVVYSDGTFDWLENVINIGFKHRRTRK